MIVERTLTAAIAFIILATAAATAIVAAAFALFFAFIPLTGPAWAAAIVAGLFGLIVTIAALLITGGRGRADEQDHELGLGLVERIIEIGKERPILSVGAGIAALMIAFRNPALVATIAAAFMDRPKERPTRRRR